MRKENQKSKINSRSLNRGYTLVELLAATSIIVIVSGLIVGILYSTLRGGNKTKVTNEVSQNGNYALSVIANTALNAEDVTAFNGASIADCTVPAVAGINGSSIQFKNPDGGLITFSCDNSVESISSSNGITTTYLIDNNAVRVDPDPLKCSFTCSQNNGNSYSLPVINVKFIVSQKGSAALFENAASSSFNTSVTMRNYNPR